AAPAGRDDVVQRDPAYRSLPQVPRDEDVPVRCLDESGLVECGSRPHDPAADLLDEPQYEWWSSAEAGELGFRRDGHTTSKRGEAARGPTSRSTSSEKPRPS